MATIIICKKCGKVTNTVTVRDKPTGALSSIADHPVAPDLDNVHFNWKENMDDKGPGGIGGLQLLSPTPYLLATT